MSKQLNRFLNFFIAAFMIFSSVSLQPVMAEEPTETTTQSIEIAAVEAGNFHGMDYQVVDLGNSQYKLVLGSEGLYSELSDYGGETPPWQKYGLGITEVQVLETVALPENVPGLFAGLGIEYFSFEKLNVFFVENADNFFANCVNLKHVDFNSRSLPNLKTAEGMFSGVNLDALAISGLDNNSPWAEIMFSVENTVEFVPEVLGGSNSITVTKNIFNCPTGMEWVEGYHWTPRGEVIQVMYSHEEALATWGSGCSNYPCYRCRYQDATGWGGWQDTTYGQYQDSCQMQSSSATVTGSVGDQTYTGSPLTPNPTVKKDGTTLTKGTDYSVSYSNNTNAGTATCKVTGITFSGSFNINFTINKAANPVTFPQTGRQRVSWSTSAQNVNFNPAQNAQGAVTYSIVSQKIDGGAAVNYFSIPTASSPTVRVAANAPQNYYLVTIKATAAGNANYNAGEKQITVAIDVIKKPNTVQVTASQSGSVDFAFNDQVKSFTAATNAIGAVTYQIASQKDASGAAADAVRIVDDTKAQFTVNPQTPTGKYTIVIQATAAGNNDYDIGTKDITYTLTINKGANSMQFPASQNLNASFSAESQKVTFAKATEAAGALTYRIVSQKNESGSSVSNFSIIPNNKEELTIAANTNPGKYTIVVEAVAQGDSNQKMGTKQSEITLIISKATNSMQFDINQSATSEYSPSPVVLDLKEATGFGAITYEIISASLDGEEVDYFTINDPSKADIKVAGKTPAGLYVVSVKAKTTGDAGHEAGEIISNVMIGITRSSNSSTAPGDTDTAPVNYSKDPQDIVIPEPVIPEGYDGYITYKIIEQVKLPSEAVNYFRIKDPGNPKITAAGGTPAGDYEITVEVKLPETSEYEAKTLTYKVQVHIDKAANEGSVTSPQDVDVVYNPDGMKGEFDPAENATGTVTYSIDPSNAEDIKNHFSIPDSSKPELAISSDTPTGDYTVKVKVDMSGDDNVEPSSKVIELKVSVAKAENPANIQTNQSGLIDYSETQKNVPFSEVENAAGEVTYRVVSSEPQATFLIANDNSSLIVPGKTPAGEYIVTVRARVAGDDNYEPVEKDITFTLTISKVNEDIDINTNQDIEVPNDPDKDTNGTFEGPSNPHGDVTYTIVRQQEKDTEETVDCFSIEDPTSPVITKKAGCPTGVYEVDVKVTDPGDENHEPSETIITLTITVDKAPSRMIAGDAQTVVVKYSDQAQTADFKAPENTLGAVTYDIRVSTLGAASTTEGISVKDNAPQIIVPASLKVGEYNVPVIAKDSGNEEFVAGTVLMDITLKVDKASSNLPTVPDEETLASIEYPEEDTDVDSGDTFPSDRELTCTVKATHSDGTVVEGFKMDCNTGKITVPAGTKPGVYDLEITVTDPGDENHEPSTIVYHREITIEPAENDMEVDANQSISAPYSVDDQDVDFKLPENAKGKLTCSIAVKDSAGNTVAGFKVNCETGKITAPGGLIGVYDAVITITDDGGDFYKPVTKVINARITIGAELTEEQKCKIAGKFWYNNKCNDKDMSDEEKCKLAGKYWYNNKCNDKDMSAEEKCKLAGKFWYNNKCNDKDMSAEEKCKLAGKFWYNNKCNDKDMTAEEKCKLSGKYWYNNKCNDKPQNVPVNTGSGNNVLSIVAIGLLSIISVISAVIYKKRRILES